MLSQCPMQIVLILPHVVKVAPRIVADAHVHTVAASDADVGRTIERRLCIRKELPSSKSAGRLVISIWRNGDHILVPVECDLIQQVFSDGLSHTDLGGIARGAKDGADCLEAAI